MLEGSKGFTKDLCARDGIPTAAYVRVETAAEARAALDRFAIPVVIKADGLAAGKGVTVAMTRAEAEAAIAAAGDGPMVIEEFLDGEEASLFALVDGDTRGGRSPARRTTSASARAIPAPTPAAWAPIPPPRSSPPSSKRARCARSSSRPRGRWPRRERRSRACCSPG